MLDPISKFVLDHVIDPLSGVMVPLMFAVFVVGIVARAVIYYMARGEARFAREFEKRVRFYFSSQERTKGAGFFRLTRILLEKTYHDCFEKREQYKRRNMDYTLSLLDRLFLIQDGVKRISEDTLGQIRYLRREEGSHGASPKMVEVVKSAYDSNPYFNKIFGLIPVNVVHEFLNILPGLFLVGGIFGTFIGISKGLPELGGMDLADMEGTKKVMDLFLLQISQAMVKSIVGIGMSAVMTMINTVFGTEATYYTGVNRFVAGLERVWNETANETADTAQDSGEAATSDSGLKAA